MDQSSRCWIQKEGANCLNPHVLSSFGDSWEEQAFAEDASGPLGGCIWPPRSYTCSFCRREFRSAQALGGHMNVHRRDRARLKQVSSPNNNHQLLEPSSTSTLDRCVLKKPANEISNPNFDLDRQAAQLFSSSSPARPSSTVSILRPAAFTCSFGQDQQKICTPILSWSKFEPRKRFHIADFGNQQEKDYCTQVVVESNSIISNKNINTDHQIEVHVTSNLNSVIRKRCETPILDDDENDSSFIFKRRRVADDHDARSNLYPRNSILVNVDEKDAKKVAPLEHSPNSTLENLDLELRLGDRPS